MTVPEPTRPGGDPSWGPVSSTWGHPRIDSLLDQYGRRLDSEHQLLSNRMSWLLALDSFLVAILGVGLASLDQLGARDLAFWLMLGVSVVGLLTNTSSLFSNYWAGRAIDEASLCLSAELQDLTLTEGAPGSNAALRRLSPEGERWVGRLRLYGRDPRAELERVGFWRPPSGVLHPWYFVPIVFMLAFAAVPFALWRIWSLGDWAGTAALLGAISGPAVLVIVTLADYLYNLWRAGLWVWDDLMLRWHRRSDANARARDSRQRARQRNQAELTALRDAHRERGQGHSAPEAQGTEPKDTRAVTAAAEVASTAAGAER